MKILATLFLCLIFSLMALGQSKHSDKAVVYLYTRDAPSVIGKLRAKVFMDATELVHIPQNQYCIAIIEPGKHSFHFSKGKEASGIEKDFEAGQTYYLRIGWKQSFTIKPDGLDPVAPEVAAYDLKQIKPITEKDIKAKSIVVTKLD